MRRALFFLFPYSAACSTRVECSELILQQPCYQHEEPVGGEGGGEASDGVGEDGFGGELAVADRVKHGGVGAQEAAPAHADGGEDRDSIAVYPALLHEGGDESQGGADGTQGGDREGYQVGVL